jgi:hypothetical protein
VLSGLLVLAVPARAQQAVDRGAELREAVAPAPKLNAEPQQAPALLPTHEQVAERVRVAEAAREAGTARAAGHGDYIYLIAAIVVGIVIAAVVLN